MEVNISDLTWDQFIYPRGGKSEKTVNAYVEALAIGAQFPPIKIQRVFNYADGTETTEAIIIIDGIHRWFAFKEKGIKEIAAVEWKDEPLDYEKNKTSLLLESAAGVNQQRVSQITNNTNFGDISNLLAQGHAMEYIAKHYHMDLALAWAIHLSGKTDQEKFKALYWGLRTWDQWKFNKCDERFGDDWPGRIPAQLVAHTLYFTKPGDLILDPMAGGGVVSDVCMLFERKCQSFDIATRDNRPEIQYHHWGSRDEGWPIIRKPDLIFFDPPYYIKKEKAYREMATEKTPSISSYTKAEYKRFFESFFLLAHKNAKPTTRMAFLNADWRDFESTPASKEKPDKSITIFDYHRLLSEAGWKVTHRIECPLSSERLTGNQVQKMQDKRILGTVGRTLLIAKKS